jgi:hypothetical protein
MRIYLSLEQFNKIISDYKLIKNWIVEGIEIYIDESYNK